MKNLFVIFGSFYFAGTLGAQDCKTCDYEAQTNEVMEFQVQVKPKRLIEIHRPNLSTRWTVWTQILIGCPHGPVIQTKRHFCKGK